MGDLQRWSLREVDFDCYDGMETSDTGDWVRWEDVQAQAAEIERLKGASGCCVQCEEHTREIERLEAQRDELLEAARPFREHHWTLEHLRRLRTAIDRARGGAK